jgi:CheY-like chemotaxis protein
MLNLPQILLIDDSRQDLDLIQEACADHGVQAVFHLAQDGHEGIQCLGRLAQDGSSLNLVVLDLFLPRKDGFAVLQHLQSPKHPYRDVPVLVLSASADMRHVERSFKLGASFFLWKPAVYDDYAAVAQRISDLLNAPPKPPDPGPLLKEREEAMWNLHSPSRWAGLGG